MSFRDDHECFDYHTLAIHSLTLLVSATEVSPPRMVLSRLDVASIVGVVQQGGSGQSLSH